MALGLGPVFAMEWLTTSRRWQVYAGRSAFVGVLLLGLSSVWVSSVMGRPPLTIGEAAGVGRGFFAAIALVQIISILVVGPVALAGAICQEKARGNLGLLLLTDLSDAEIVLGTLAARLVPVFGLVFCALPVLALGSLLGGIDPLALFGSLLISVGLAALGSSIAFTLSVWGTRAHEVLLATFAFYLVWLLGLPIWDFFAWFRGLPLLPRWAQSAHPTFLAFAPYARPDRVSPADYLGFLAGCLAASAGLVVLSIRRIRSVVVRQASGGAGGRVAGRRRFRGADLDRHPLLWYERHRARPTRWITALIRFYFAISIAFSALAIEDCLRPSTPMRGWFPAYVNAFQVAIGMALLLIPAALATAEERSRGSLDILLTTPIASSSVVLAKWWGVYRQVPLVLALPVIVADVLAWQRGGREAWGFAALIVAEILAMGAAWTSLGLALSTWIPRVGRATSAAVSAYILGALGLPILALALAGSDELGFGLPMISPFYGSFYLTLGGGDPGFFAHADRWGLIWIAFHLAVAGALLLATLATFNARLGRIPERSRPRKDAPPLAVPRRRPRGPTVRAWLALVAVLAGLLGLVDSLWLAPYRRELRSAARFTSLGGRVALVDETPSFLKRWGIDWFDLRTVAVLDLDGSEVRDADLALLADFPHVGAVFLRDTAITDAGLVHLRKLHTGLIDLSRTRLDRPDFEFLPDVYYGLRDLDLSGNRLRALKFGGITRYLTSLDLAGTGIDDEALGGLSTLTSLNELDLSETEVTDSGIDRVVLASLENLAWINLAGTRVTAEGVARLRKLRPGLTVTLTPGAKGKFMDVGRPPPPPGGWFSP